MSPSPSCETLGTFERRVGEQSPTSVDASSSFRTLAVLDLGLPNLNGEIVLARVSN